MKKQQLGMKEIREVLSAEITARRSGNEKVIKRVADVETREESALNELRELLGTHVKLLQDQIDAIPGMVAAAKEESKKFTVDECDKVKREMFAEVKELDKKLKEVNQQVGDLKVESERTKEHMQMSFDRVNAFISDVEKHSKKNEHDLFEERVSREKGDHACDVKIVSMVEAEEAERQKGDGALEEKLSKTSLSLFDKIESDDERHYNASKKEVHDLDMACQRERIALAEKVIEEARTMDEQGLVAVRKDISDHLVLAKSYADAVSNEKSSHLHGTMELLRESLTKQTDAVKAGLDLEVNTRAREMTSANDLTMGESKKLRDALEEARKAGEDEAARSKEERNKIVEKISASCESVEETMGQQIISESRSIRSLIKASVAAEASDRMADVNDAKQVGEKRLKHEVEILGTRVEREKEFVLQKSAEWVDTEKAGRMAADISIQNEMDVRRAAAAARSESREVLGMICDHIQDVDTLNRQRELVWDVRKLRTYGIETRKDLGTLKEESEIGDSKLGERVDTEAEQRSAEISRLDSKVDEAAESLGVRLGEEERGRVEEILRMDGRVDILWEEKYALEERVEEGERHVNEIEEATASAIRSETKARLEEDAEILEEEACRKAAENSMRYLVDKVSGALEAEERIEELNNSSDRFTVADKKMQRYVADVATRNEDRIRSVQETFRVEAASEHREIVQLITDETGAVRTNVHDMLTEIQKAVEGAEGSVATLDTKTETSIGDLVKTNEQIKAEVEEGLTRVATEAKEAADAKLADEIKAVTEKIDSIEKERTDAGKAVEEELAKVAADAKETAKGIVAEEIKVVNEKIGSIEKEQKEQKKKGEGIDWDNLRKKGGVEGGNEKEKEKEETEKEKEEEKGNENGNGGGSQNEGKALDEEKKDEEKKPQ